MKKQILIVTIILILSLTLVKATILTRTPSSTTVVPGSTFIVTYSTSGVSGKWFVAWNDNITGGCTPTSYQAFMSSPSQGSSTNDQKVATFTAPSSGSCTFSGYYQYSNEAKINFIDLTITIVGENGCNPNWQCTSWSTCTNNQQTRTCTDLNICNVSTNKPTEIQTCSTQCIPYWSCTGWSACANNQQTRSCSDLNNCNNLTGKPIESQYCSINCVPNWHCSDWDSCSGGSKDRTCTDLNNCGTDSGKPSESTDCSSSRHYYNDYVIQTNVNDNTNTNSPVEENPPTITIQQSNPSNEVNVLGNKKTNSITGASIGVSGSSNLLIGLSVLTLILLVILIVIVIIGKR